MVLTTGIFWRIWTAERGLRSYRKYARWFHPFALFVTLVPLSHVSANSWALVPPLLEPRFCVRQSSSLPRILRTVKQERAHRAHRRSAPCCIFCLRIEREFVKTEEIRVAEWHLENARAEFLTRVGMVPAIHRRVG